MGRLIREDNVMRMLTGVELNNGTITDAKIELRNVKTAYDVEKVEEQLDEYITKIVGRKSALYQTIMRIVRKGGAE